MGKLLDGKLVSDKIRDDLKLRVSNLNINPCLCVISIGEDEASKVYIRTKERASFEVGYLFKHICFSGSDSENDIVNTINDLNHDSSVHGIIVQLPIPKNFNRDRIINTISPLKDVDGLTNISVGNMFSGNSTNIPCTPLGIMKIFDYYNISLRGKHVVIVGRSNLVGKPLLQLCLERNATVTICHSETVDLSFYTKQADILIVAVGKKDLINKEMVKDGVVIIDVGINRVMGKIYGDVSSDTFDKCSYMTPVPGGVGPMTVACLLLNVMTNYNNINNI